MAGIRHHKDLTGVDLHVTKLHAVTHLTGGTDPLGLGTASIADVPATGDASAIQVVLGNDTRLSNARTPSIHIHGEGDVTDLVTDLAAKVPKSLLTEQGDVIYAAAVATPAALPHGIVGQVLQSGGHGANPSWLTLGTMAAAVATDYVPKSLFDAYSVLYADTDNIPARLTVGASTVVGRAAAGGIVALAKSDLLTLLNVADGANAYVHPNHSGDVTSVADGATTIVAGTVTLAKMANMATASLIYRKTAAAGAPEVNSLATLKTDLGLTGTNSGDQTLASLGLDADLATLVLPANTTITDAGAELINDAAASNQRTTLGLGTMAVETATDYLAKAIVTAKGDVIAASANATPVHLAVGTDGQVLTADAASAAGVKWGNAGAGTVTAITGTFPIVSSGGLTPAISLSDAGVTYAKIQNISATDKLLGRSTAGAGSPEEIACTAAGRAILDDADAAAQRVTLGTAAYSEGTWTPVLAGATIVGTAPVLTGYYKTIGTMVFITCIINAGSGGNTSVAFGANLAYIEGFATVAGTPESPIYSTCTISDMSAESIGTGEVYGQDILLPLMAAKTVGIIITAVYGI